MGKLEIKRLKCMNPPQMSLTGKSLLRLDFVDALRGIAVCGVILIHTGAFLRVFNPHLNALVNSGARGVQLFFIISAFTIFLSFQTRKESSLQKYFIRRFFRIAPMFYLVLFVTVFFLSIVPINIPSLLAEISFISNFYPKWTNSQIIGVEWTIGVEMIFYVLAPFLFKKIKRLTTALFFAFITFLIPLIIFSMHWYPKTTEWQAYRAFSLISHLYIFAIGIVIFFLFNKYQKFEERYQKNISNICLGVLSIAIIADLAGIENQSNILKHFFSLNLQFIFYFSLLFFASIKSCIRFLWVNPVTIHMGKISYSAYLIHLTFNSIIISIFPKNIQAGYIFIISFITTILVSSITYRLIEKPFIKLSYSIVKKKYAPNI